MRKVYILEVLGETNFIMGAYASKEAAQHVIDIENHELHRAGVPPYKYIIQELKVES